MSSGKKGIQCKRILVVEDNVIVADLVKEVLEAEGFEVEPVWDGMEGLEKIKQREYDAILSNYDMPRMNGSELYMEVRLLSPGLAEKIIFMAGYVDVFIRATGNRFLPRPFSPKQLIDVITGFIAQIKAQQAYQSN